MNHDTVVVMGLGGIPKVGGVGSRVFRGSISKLQCHVVTNLARAVVRVQGLGFWV